jgi:sigma-B regulation protein RsbU (phosphoserine phosphatase)
VNDLGAVLDAFKAANACEASVWTRAASGAITWESATNRPPPAQPPLPPDRWPTVADGAVEVETAEGPAVVAAIPGPRTAWLLVGPTQSRALDIAAQLRFLAPVVGQFLQAALEVEHAANELAERYEEINLLYTISEILGRTVAMDEVSGRILTEVSETVGARRAAVFIHDATAKALLPIAAIGVPLADVTRVPVDSADSVTAMVFRACHARIVEAGEDLSPADAPVREGAMLSVPIMWTSPRGGAEPLGVVNLSARRSRQPFTAGDQKLMSAIATQIGTAIQNARLVRESLAQQRFRQEMQLAHELQMRLLPSVDIVAPAATVAARVVPAESVGGDLYNLFRLGPGKTGLMIGDVSGHGYQAALIMALAMSASAIHAQTTSDPGETIGALLDSMRDELTTTEMFISLFYAVVDREAGVLRFANAGHPHAFVIHGNGEVERLPAMDPPVGMGTEAPHGDSRPWTSDDLLLVFTDGISDARNHAGDRLGEERVVELAKRHRKDAPARILERVFELLDGHTGDTRRRDDLTLVALRS